MPKKIRSLLKKDDGTPAIFGAVLAFTVEAIRRASIAGVGLYLSAESVRSLEWSIIREEGGYSNDAWREGSWSELGEGSYGPRDAEIMAEQEADNG